MTVRVGSEPPDGLAVRGKRLWAEALADHPGFGAGERVLLAEACRLADRCDGFDRLLGGHPATWATIRSRDGLPSELVVDSVMGEARQTAGQLRQCLAALGLVAVKVKAESTAVPAKSELDKLRERKAAR